MREIQGASGSSHAVYLMGGAFAIALANAARHLIADEQLHPSTHINLYTGVRLFQSIDRSFKLRARRQRAVKAIDEPAFL